MDFIRHHRSWNLQFIKSLLEKKKKHDNDYKCEKKKRENQFTTKLVEDSYKRIRGNVGLNISFNGETLTCHLTDTSRLRSEETKRRRDARNTHL